MHHILWMCICVIHVCACMSGVRNQPWMLLLKSHTSCVLKQSLSLRPEAHWIRVTGWFLVAQFSSFVSAQNRLANPIKSVILDAGDQTQVLMLVGLPPYQLSHILSPWLLKLYPSESVTNWYHLNVVFVYISLIKDETFWKMQILCGFPTISAYAILSWTDSFPSFLHIRMF